MLNSFTTASDYRLVRDIIEIDINKERSKMTRKKNVKPWPQSENEQEFGPWIATPQNKRTLEV